jgi:GST-like protein
MQWAFFQMAFIGPMFGQVGYFNVFEGKAIEDKRVLQRYVDIAKDVLGVLEKRLDGRTWIMDEDYTIADVSMPGWVRQLIGEYKAKDLVGFQNFPHVAAWLERGLARPAVQRGLQIPARIG